MANFPNFTPLPALIGGLMLSSSVSALLALTGNVLGISGFIHKSVNAGLHLLVQRPSSTASNINITGGHSYNSNGRNHDSAGGNTDGGDDTANPRATSLSSIDKINKIRQTTSTAIAATFTIGLILGGLLLSLLSPTLTRSLSPLKVQFFDIPPLSPSLSLPTLFLSSLAIGFGTKLASGCTSGHFLCGISRLSLRSIVATGVFFGTAVGVCVFSGAASFSGDGVGGVVTNIDVGDVTVQTILSLLALQIPALIYAILIPILASTTSPTLSSTLPAISTLFISLHFSFGLGLSGMLRPSKVLGFLNLSPSSISNGSWDPSLALLAAGGIIPNSLYWFFVVRPKVVEIQNRRENIGEGGGSKPLLTTATTPLIPSTKAKESSQPLFYPSCTWSVPTNSTNITTKLILGSVIFGIGWGLTGLCPGPIVVNLGSSGNGLGEFLRFAGFLGGIAVGGVFGGFVEGWSVFERRISW